MVLSLSLFVLDYVQSQINEMAYTISHITSSAYMWLFFVIFVRIYRKVNNLL